MLAGMCVQACRFAGLRACSLHCMGCCCANATAAWRCCCPAAAGCGAGGAAAGDCVHAAPDPPRLDVQPTGGGCAVACVLAFSCCVGGLHVSLTAHMYCTAATGATATATWLTVYSQPARSLHAPILAGAAPGAVPATTEVPAPGQQPAVAVPLGTSVCKACEHLHPASVHRSFQFYHYHACVCPKWPLADRVAAFALPTALRWHGTALH